MHFSKVKDSELTDANAIAVAVEMEVAALVAKETATDRTGVWLTRCFPRNSNLSLPQLMAQGKGLRVDFPNKLWLHCGHNYCDALGVQRIVL